LASDLKPPNSAAADPLFGVPTADLAGNRLSRGFSSWRLPVIRTFAASVIIVAVAYRLWEAHLPKDVLQEEGLLIGAGAVYAAVVVSIRGSRLFNRVPVQLGLMASNALLAVAVLGVAGPWLGNDLLPLASSVFATTLLYFDLGFLTRHFPYLLAIAVAGLAALWIDAAVVLHASLGEIVTWALVLFGLALLAYVTHRIVDGNLVMQAQRQASLLHAISDIGEGLVITEDGRFVAGNSPPSSP
jgi:hypothetical protein